MILNSLCDYYDLLCQVEDSDISPFGFQKIPASYAATLSAAGDLLDIVSLKELNDNRPQEFLIPKSMKTTAISASPVCDNLSYVFGVGFNKGEKTFEYKKFETAKLLHLLLFDQAKTDEAFAIKRFFEKWNVADAWENEHLLKHCSEKSKGFSGNVVFKLDGKCQYFHETPEIIDIWQTKNEALLAQSVVKTAQCSITGKISPIARCHKNFKGIKGATTTGASLVCFNNDADVSYGLDQSRNSAVSEEVAFKYHTALSYLLADWDRNLQIGDATTVFWAEKMDETYTDIFKLMLNNPDEIEEGINEDSATVKTVQSILQDGSQGIYNDAGLDLNTKFYILGLSPNAGRLSVRFFYRDSFGNFCDQIKKHYDDIGIYGGTNGKAHIKLWWILLATVSTKIKNREKKINPLLGGAVTRAIFTGDQYPQVLFDQIMIRAKVEDNLSQEMAAIIKGYLNRKNRFQKKMEEFGMYLNETSTNPAYVLGRTFAILEIIQKNASGNGLNTTIKNKYFASACANPAMVFPNLLILAQNHLAVIEKTKVGYAIDLNKKLGQCLGLLECDSFPKVLDMSNQGRFILGYYQQTQKNYEKREVKAEVQNGEC